MERHVSCTERSLTIYRPRSLRDGIPYLGCLVPYLIWSRKRNLWDKSWNYLELPKASDTPGDFIRRSRRIWSPAKIAKRFSPPIDADTPGDFFRRSQRCGSFENSCDKIAQPDGLALLAIHSNKRRNRGNEHTWQMPANLIADIWHARYWRFYTPIAAIGENRNRCTGHTWRFSSIAAIGV